MGIKSTVKGLCMVNVAWEEQANGPEGAYCRVVKACQATVGILNSIGAGAHQLRFPDIEVAKLSHQRLW